VILYDDFLGQTRYDQLKFGKNEDSQLIRLIKLAERSDNIRFILTTREYIIADARLSHGVFDTHVDNIVKCTINLGDYSRAHRAKVLFNHLYFSDLPQEKLDAIVSSEIYKDIIDHKHFNPRIIQAISMRANSESLNARDFVEYISSKLDDPAEIWHGPFSNQIMPLSRWILAVLWTMNGKADVRKLKNAVVALQGSAFEAETALQFTKCLREIANNFTTSETYPHALRKSEVIEISFQNPSIKDYIESFLVSEVAWVETIAENIIYSAQFEQLGILLKKLDERVSTHVAQKLIQRYQVAPGEPKGDTYRNGLGELVFTDNDLYSRYDEALTILKISERAIRIEGVCPGHKFLTTINGWISLLGKISESGAVAYSIRRLVGWVVSSKYWVVYEYKIKKSFYYALMNCVHSMPRWCEELSTINILHECSTIIGIELSALDKLKFQHDADCRAREIFDCEESTQALDEAADHLEQLQQRMKIGSGKLVAQLRGKSDSLYSESSSIMDGIDTAISTSSEDEVDVDLMFSELLSGRCA